MILRNVRLNNGDIDYWQTGVTFRLLWLQCALFSYKDELGGRWIEGTIYWKSQANQTDPATPGEESEA